MEKSFPQTPVAGSINLVRGTSELKQDLNCLARRKIEIRGLTATP